MEIGRKAMEENTIRKKSRIQMSSNIIEKFFVFGSRVSLYWNG